VVKPLTLATADRAGQEVAELILSEVARAGLVAGSRLPTERQLAADLGLTRTTVRHALALLAAGGLVSREVGRGTYLRAAAVSFDGDGEHDGGSVPGFNDVGPADVMAVRRLLEPQAMALVVARATTRDFEEMDRCLVGGDAAETYPDFEAWDHALHRGIIAASHNPLLIRLYGPVESARGGQLWGDLKRRADSRPRREQYRREHRAIVAALRARDSTGATEAMQVHLASVEANLLG
jgi:GntR family transcriptional regulator, uxu operon transcriptional repressor